MNQGRLQYLNNQIAFNAKMISKGCPKMTVAEIGVFSRMIHDIKPCQICLWRMLNVDLEMVKCATERVCVFT